MLATVMALYNAAGLITPLLYGRGKEEGLLKRRLAVLVATASLVVMMLLVMAPVALAVDVPHNGRGPFAPPPGTAPGGVLRSETGKVHDLREHTTGPRL
jgi:hypothetical protein